MPHPFVIAEAGSCHEGSYEKALELTSVAQTAGADAIKWQYWSSPVRMRERRHIASPAYDTGSVRTEWLEGLQKAAHTLGLQFSATVYLPEDVIVLRDYVDYWKVASFEARDRALLREIPPERPLYVSTGMMKEHELAYIPKRAVRMHCVSAYPCPPYEANLGAVEFGHGYSDHTRSVFTGAFAVCAGADTLEVHFRLANTSETCPDFPVALDPESLKRYVALAREAWKMRGDGRKEPQMAERDNMRYRVTS